MNLRNYTMSLPRDLSVTSDGLLRQRFIPELQKLRIASSHVHVGGQPLAPGGIPKAAFVKGAAGRQLEIMARFRVGASALKFGLTVLANPTMAEYTSITLDPAREHVLLDRRQSGVSVDSDVRGGPWPGAAAAGEILLHVYVDQAVVELIATGSATTATKVDGAPIIESTAVADGGHDRPSGLRLILIGAGPSVAVPSSQMAPLCSNRFAQSVRNGSLSAKEAENVQKETWSLHSDMIQVWKAHEDPLSWDLYRETLRGCPAKPLPKPVEVIRKIH